MKKLLFILLIFITANAFSQRFIKQKNANVFLIDSVGNLVQGTANQMRNYIDANISADDSSRFEIVANLTANSGRISYRGDDDAEELVDLNPLSTVKINRIKRPRQGMLRYDRTVDKLRLYSNGVWRYIMLE